MAEGLSFVKRQASPNQSVNTHNFNLAVTFAKHGGQNVSVGRLGSAQQKATTATSKAGGAREEEEREDGEKGEEERKEERRGEAGEVPGCESEEVVEEEGKQKAERVDQDTMH